MPFLSRSRNQLLVLFLCCIGFVFLVRPWQLYFLNDDFLHIPADNHFLFLRGGFMRPVPNFFLLWDKLLYGKQALGFFVTSLVLHLTTVFCAYYLVKQVVARFLPSLQHSLLAFSTAVLFLFYPFHAESVMWVISRVSIMTAAFTFLSILFYIKSYKHGGWVIASWFWFVVALFSYESMWNIVFFFAVISVLNVVQNYSSRKRELLIFGLMLATFIAYLGIRVINLKTLAGDGYENLNDNLRNIPLVLINLVKLTGRNYTPPFVNTNASIIVFLVFTAFYAFCTYKLFKFRSYLGWFGVLLWLGVISGVVTAAPLGIDTHYNESDRYLYYSSFYFCFFIGLLLVVFFKSKGTLAWLATISMVFIVMFAKLQLKFHYASTVTRSTLEVAAANPIAKRAYFVDVPERYNGCVVFFVGLPEAIHWILPQVKYDSTIVYSQVEMASGILPFKLGNVSWQQIAAEKGWPAAVPILPANALMQQSDTLAKGDLLFWYRKDGLYKVAF